MASSTIPRAFPVDLPGVTISWLAKANGRSSSAIARARHRCGGLSGEAIALVACMTPELAVAMAEFRPRRGMLPYWSRLAIAELASQGMSYASLMELFKVGRSTVYRAIKGKSGGFAPFTGRRLVSRSQAESVRRS